VHLRFFKHPIRLRQRLGQIAAQTKVHCFGQQRTSDKGGKKIPENLPWRATRDGFKFVAEVTTS
jgi:hypothetical protein